MKKRTFLLISFLVLFSFSVFADDTSSDSDTQIQIFGCSVDEKFAPVGGCIYIDSDTAYYCAAHNTPLDTLVVHNACSKMETPSGSEIYGGASCCPHGGVYGCYAKDDGGESYFICAPATTDCRDLDHEDCYLESDRCYWDYDELPNENYPDANGTCMARVGNCYEYYDQAECEEDPQNVSKNDPNCRYGVTESGGIPYTINQESCVCYWENMSTTDTGDDRCALRYQINNSFGNVSYAGICEYFYENVTDCVDGFQDYAYKVKFTNSSIHPSAILLAGDARCTERSGRRRCGDPVVKIPFFNFINLLLVVMLISLFYFYKTKFKYLDIK